MTAQRADRVFLKHVLPRAMTHALISFRDVADQHERDDLVQEVLVYCLIWTRVLLRQGKDPRAFPSALARYGVRAVRNGRRVCGQNTTDALSPQARAAHGFDVIRLSNCSTLKGTSYEEALIDNTMTPPDEQTAFRIDFADWLTTLDERSRRIVEAMAVRRQTSELAGTFGISPGRVSQLRREFLREWRRFHGEQA